jgi:hypothetical protein
MDDNDTLVTFKLDVENTLLVSVEINSVEIVNIDNCVVEPYTVEKNEDILFIVLAFMLENVIIPPTNVDRVIDDMVAVEPYMLDVNNVEPVCVNMVMIPVDKYVFNVENTLNVLPTNVLPDTVWTFILERVMLDNTNVLSNNVEKNILEAVTVDIFVVLPVIVEKNIVFALILDTKRVEANVVG